MGRNNRFMKGTFARRAHAQGMVEFALSLPLLLLVLAGLMEIANLLLLYSRMDSATREASRFGALGGTETGVREVFYQSSRESLETQPGVLELWMVRPVLDFNEGAYGWENASTEAPWGVDENGDPMEVVCVYPGEGQCENSDSGLNSQDILNQIKNSGATRDSADGDRFVIVATYYEARTILNLPFFKVPGGESGRVPLRSVAVYRQEVAQETVNMLAGGCTALPIMINMNAVSDRNNMVMNTEAVFPQRVAREGAEFTLTRNPNLAHVDRESNPDAPGTAFDFLAWQIYHQQANKLNASLTFPGNISDPDNGYVHPFDHAANFSTPDRMLNLGDPVAAQAEGVEASDLILADRLYTNADSSGFQRSIRVVLSDGISQTAPYSAPNTTTFYTYEAMGFAVVHILGYSEQTDTLRVEFVRFDRSCGEAKK